MNELSTTAHGRLLCTAIAISLIGGGIAALLGGSIAGIASNPACMAILCVALVGAIGISLIAVALSIEEEPWFGFLGGILLPVAMFLYWIGLQLAVENQARWGIYGFMALGALFGINALRGKKLEAASGAPQPAHAH